MIRDGTQVTRDLIRVGPKHTHTESFLTLLNDAIISRSGSVVPTDTFLGS